VEKNNQQRKSLIQREYCVAFNRQGKVKPSTSLLSEHLRYEYMQLGEIYMRFDFLIIIYLMFYDMCVCT